jgi:hypothetical protein
LPKSQKQKRKNKELAFTAVLENVVEDGREGGEEGRASTSLKKSMVFLIYS